MIAEQIQGAHSARVQMELIVKGSSIGVTRMGPDFVRIQPSQDFAPGEATLVLRIDDCERRWQVHLPDGVSRRSDRVPLALCT